MGDMYVNVELSHSTVNFDLQYFEVNILQYGLSSTTVERSISPQSQANKMLLPGGASWCEPGVATK